MMSKSVWTLVAGEQQECPPIEITPEAAEEIMKAVKEFAEWRDSYKPPRCNIDMAARYD